jgi:hypothetical protein
MMDLGLGRFFELFEERFGRLATNTLLLITGLGLASACIGLTYEHIAKPLYDLISEMIGVKVVGKFSYRELIAALGTAIITAILCFILYKIVDRRLQRQIDAIAKQIRESAAKLQDAVITISEATTRTNEATNLSNKP